MDCEHIRDELKQDPNWKWGFVIYRCTYGDDAAWNRFMEHLNTIARLSLEAEEGSDLLSRLDWSVQEDPSLNEAPIRKIREKFVAWVAQDRNPDFWGSPRHHACIAVDESDLKSVLGGPPAEKFDVDGEGSVTLVSVDENEGYEIVGISLLAPRIYSLLCNMGWRRIVVEADVPTP